MINMPLKANKIGLFTLKKFYIYEMIKNIEWVKIIWRISICWHKTILLMEKINKGVDLLSR